MLGALFFLSGAAALIYEVVWIRLFAISFGNTAQAMSIVLGIYLGGIAAGSTGASKFARRSGRESLFLYGIAELFVSTYALLIPLLLRGVAPLLEALYGDGHTLPTTVTLVRAIAGSAVLFPATCAMGATLPLLARWISTRKHTTARIDAGRWVSILYSINLAGATGGAILGGFVLLPGLGFARTLEFACAWNALTGLAAMWLARGAETETETADAPAHRAASTARPILPVRVTLPVAFLSGGTCFLYEVAWGRVYGLLFGPTASTLTLILAVFLVGLTGGGVWAGRLKRNPAGWLCAAQAFSAAALIWALAAAGASPPWIADWVRTHSSQPAQIELMKVGLLLLALLPLTLLFGLIFPLTMRAGAADAETFASRIGGLYGINTAGCIAGSVAAGWWLIPALGTERTLLLGGALNLGLALLLLDYLRPKWRGPAFAAAGAGVILAAFFFPRWDMAAMTAGGYKYAPYYTSSNAVHAGDLLWVHEGITGTVAVRQDGAARVLSIDGKVDASDAGGDLLTEKLLAHLPLLLQPAAERVCLIGLASGVTAGAALTHSIRRLDVVEISRDVVRASHDFDGVNGRPLEDGRTTLIVNDGRNHLALASARYDVIISEPSNPWIAGMNNLFTRDFFRIARARLRPGGIFAQWFHIYNMPPNDLRSLV
ncbi:MAG TPA: fused MFS/spermidine synthase, partial [Bryobacteraceae bacterium]|nr:fused MFS/spermidine synthase [Bryobacteraceae bacterium]